MNKKARKAFKVMVKAGFVISVWRDKKRRKFACEVSKPAWAGSCVENGKTISDAVLKAIASALAEDEVHDVRTNSSVKR